MSNRTVSKRAFHTFLSHAHVDNEIVGRLHRWLTEAAGVPVWYDAVHLPPSASIATALPAAIAECRGMIIAISRASLQSGWVQEEYNAGIGQRTMFRDYRVVPVRLDDSEVPHFLQTTKWIDLAGGKIDLSIANDLLASIYGEEPGAGPRGARDVYISRTWRDSEALLADYVCQFLVKRGLRLIGDSKDQAGFDEGQRVKSIVSSCGALVAILPDRGGGKTSEYMLKEIAFAKLFALPCLIVADSTVQLPPEVEETLRFPGGNVGAGCPFETELMRGIDRIEEEFEKPRHPHYTFLATVFGDEHGERNRVLRQVIERVAAMECVLGDDIREGQIQQIIIRLVRDALFLIADISEDNLNTCIEAGVALGANRRLHLVAKGPRRRPAFMFRDQQVWHNDDDAELVGKVHQIAYPYRRRVLNRELPR